MKIIDLKRSNIKSFLADPNTYVNFICALYVLLFIYAATSKILDYHGFLIQLQKSPFLSDFSGVFSILVPTSELLISILLMIPNLVKFGLYSAFALMFLFTAYIIAILNYSESIPCSCGGIIANMNWNQHLIFNIIFLIVAITGVLLKK